MRRLAVVILLVSTAAAANAQARRRIPRVAEPSMWVSAGIGIFNGNGVNDGNTNSSWDFGNASTPQYRLGLEKAFSTTISAGLAATYTHVPFEYRGESGCSACSAHLDMTTLGATVRYGGGIGLHGILEGTAGIVDYANLKRDSDGQKLPPTGGNIDPYFVFGTGFGYNLNPQTEISIVQDFGLALHERDGLGSQDSNTLRQRTLRLNFRYGFGSRIRTTRPGR